MKILPHSPAWGFLGRAVGVTLLTIGVSRAEEDSAIPHAWPIARYDQLKRQCPFALATPVTTTAPTTQAGFAANWYVSGIAHLDGQDFVTIKSRDLSTEFSLYGHETNAVHGVCLASVEWSDKIGRSIVIVKRGLETAKLEFNEAEAANPAKVTTDAGIGKSATNVAQNNATGANPGHGEIIATPPVAASLYAPIPTWTSGNEPQSRLRRAVIQAPSPR